MPKDESINVLDLLIILVRYKKSILIAPVIFGFIAFINTLSMKNIYTADTQIMPPQQQSSAAAFISQISGVGGAVGIKNPSDIYVSMLKSRSLQNNLIQRFDLIKVYHAESLGKARRALTGATKISAGKDGLITLSVDDQDPRRSALLANGYVEELQKLTQVLAVTEASQRRMFYEKQLLQIKEHLSDAEIGLKQTQESTGLIQLDAQAVSVIQATASLRAEIAMKDVQLNAMKSFATGNHPDYMRVQQELSGLRSQLSKVETGSVSSSKVPGAGLEYMRKVRDVKYYEAIYEMLGKQLEMARLDEAKQSSVIQVLDKAVVPEQKSKPKRRQIVIVYALIGLVVALLKAFGTEMYLKVKEDPLQNERIKLLRKMISWKKI